MAYYLRELIHACMLARRTKGASLQAYTFHFSRPGHTDLDAVIHGQAGKHMDAQVSTWMDVIHGQAGKHMDAQACTQKQKHSHRCTGKHRDGCDPRTGKHN
eukprot:1156772-Pelagomonas_calceolata.AAC.10